MRLPPFALLCPFILFCPFILSSLLVPAPRAQSPSLPRAADLLAKYEAGLGTREAIAKIENVVVRSTLRFEGMPGVGSLEEIYAGKDRVRWNIVLPGAAPGACSTQGADGTFAWNADPVTGVSILEGAEQAGVLRQYAAARHESWTTVYERAETVGKLVIEGRAAFEIAMFPKVGEREAWVLDAATSRLLCSEGEVPNPAGGSFAVRSWPSDWREVDGVRYPFATKVQFGARGPIEPGGYALHSEVISIEHPREIDPERVAPPKEVLEAYADPDKRTKAGKSGECVQTKAEPQPVASVRVTIPERDVAQNLAVILPEVMTYISSVGADMAGPPFCRHHGYADGKIDLEAGIPLRKKVEGKGRIQASELPGGDVAVTWHVGHYAELPSSYRLLADWMKEHGLEPRGGHWEVYWTDPGMEPDPKRWRTQVLWPVKAAK